MKFYSAAILVAFLCAVAVNASPIDDFLEKINMESLGSVTDKVKCVIVAIREPLAGSHMNDVWKHTEADMMKLSKELARCLKDSELADKPKCVTVYTTSVTKTLKKFFVELKNENHDLYQKVKENIKKCF